ncbi:MAG: hypothetical protein IJB90_05805 [Clostridia bacterium]|nr:hypothetical protein [Clostridia bacterium]
MPKHHELCTRLENAAKRGDLKKTLWMTPCHYSKFIYEGGCDGKIIKESQSPKNPLIKVCISWENACEGVEPQKLQKYIEGEIATMTSFAFKLYILACRAQQST